MSEPTTNTCPRCASPVRASIPDVGIQFECATIALESGHFSEALPCVTRQRDQLAERVRQLTTELRRADERTERAEERVRRLEAAGDQMAAWLCEPCNLGAVPFMADEWEATKGQP